MADERGTLENIALALSGLLYPLKDRLESGNARLLFAELGLQFPPAFDSIGGINSALEQTINTIGTLPSMMADLIEAIEAENTANILNLSVQLAEKVVAVITSIDQLATAIRNAGASTGLPAGDVTTFANALPQRLLDYLLVRNMERIPGLADALEFIGAVERTELNPGSTDPTNPPFTRYALDINELVNFLTSPADQLQTLYGWGTNSFDGTALLQALSKILANVGIPAIVDTSVNPPVLDAVVVEIRPRTDLNPRGLSLTINEETEFTPTPITLDGLTVTFTLNAALDAGLEILLQPDDQITFIPSGSGRAEGDVEVEIVATNPDGGPYILFGQVDGSRLQAEEFIAKLGAGLAWNPTKSQGEGEFRVSAEVKKGKIVIDLSQADGFIGTLLAGFSFESDFDLGAGFSTKDGLFFFGSSTLEIQLPVHVTLGPIEINALTISIGIDGTTFPISLAGNFKAMLGPMQAVIEQIGLTANLSLPADRSGNLGPVDFALAFKPPNGIGLSLDTGVVKGGGYLYFDFAKEEYAGALELSLAEIVTITAIGLLTTRMPDGSKGFSLLILMSVEFGTGIQLGFGFTLLAVGGLVGLNRSMQQEAIMEGVRTGAINSIMFPQDVVANAPKIISDLRTIFPPEDGTFLIGPFVKIGWGTPTLISISLGIILEIPPGNVTIIGVIKVALPADEIALIILQVNFVGGIEIDKQRIFFFASLFESRILFITLQGEMGLLVAYGNDANFVLTVGGFHPRFNPPPLPFPSPVRIAFDIINTPTALIRVESYFAVTSNTLQFGAAAQLRFGFSSFGIEGHIGFDVLIQFSPFYFIAQISASVSLKAFGVGLFSIRLSFTLEGPTPYRAKGRGSLSILFFEISADFDITWGESRDTTLPPVAVIALLTAEFEKDSNWTALLPTSSNLLVSLRELDSASDTDTLVLHPVGSLLVTQKAVPLDTQLDKVGSQKPNDAKRFSISMAAGELTKKADRDEQFAIAQFQEMDDTTKLSRPAFQPLHGGLEISVSGAQMRTGKTVKRNVRYEEIIIDNNYKRFVRRFRLFFNELFFHFMHGSSVTLSALSQHQKKQLQPFAEKIQVASEGYTVAYQSNNKAYSGTATFNSENAAREFMQQQITQDANQASTLHVIPQYEVNP
jgi:hypothetical protein